MSWLMTNYYWSMDWLLYLFSFCLLMMTMDIN